MLFAEETLQKLRRLHLAARQVRAGAVKGERRSTHRGSSVEFADFRNYSAGDDLRRLDWRAYARLGRPFIKLLEDEEDLAVHILLDTSASMNWGTEQNHKLQFALQLAAALGALALASGDQLTVIPAEQPGAAMLRPFGPLRGEGNWLRLVNYLQPLSTAPTTAASLLPSSMWRNYWSAGRRAGLVFILSDFYGADGAEIAALLNRIVGMGNEVTLLHILCPEELQPELSGDLRLLDSEASAASAQAAAGLEVSLDGHLLRIYQQRLQDWQAGIQHECSKRSAHYLPLSTALDWEQVILFEMRRMGLVK